MKVEHSSISPIARVPSEPLSEILLFLSRAMLDSRAPFPHRYHLSESLGYIKITHVCHHWREVALNSPKFWSHIDVGPLEATQELLARSNMTSLTVFAHHKYAPAHSLTLIFKALPRIQEIRLNLNSQQYAQLVSSFPEQIHRLRKVAIYNPSSTGPSDLPGIFDKCVLPSLEDLHIEGYSVPWPHPIFVSTITRLTLCSPSQGPGRNVSVGQVFDALQNLQGLQHLELSHVGSLTVEFHGRLPAPRPGHCAMLPKLNFLRLTHELPDAPNQADLLISFGSCDETVMGNIQKCFGSMVPGKDVRAFCMHGAPFSGPLYWTDTLVAMPNINYLHVRNPNPYHVLEILSPLKFQNDKNKKGVLLPKLATLKISSMRFPYRNDKYFSEFCRVLGSRRRARSGVQNLEMWTCFNFPRRGGIKALQRVVGRVMWDYRLREDDNKPDFGFNYDEFDELPDDNDDSDVAYDYV